MKFGISGSKSGVFGVKESFGSGPGAQKGQTKPKIAIIIHLGGGVKIPYYFSVFFSVARRDPAQAPGLGGAKSTNNARCSTVRAETEAPWVFFRQGKSIPHGAAAGSFDFD